MIRIRQIEQDDWPAVWEIIRPVFRAGDSWPVDPDIDESRARKYWMSAPDVSFVAEDGGGADGRILGSYFIRPNQPTLGAHVANCGYIVAKAARGRGVGSAMCRHSQEVALARGYIAMQYNLVVATNRAALHVWRNEGFEVVGRLPQAFRHLRQGLVDAYVMYKLLSPDAGS